MGIDLFEPEPAPSGSIQSATGRQRTIQNIYVAALLESHLSNVIESSPGIPIADAGLRSNCSAISILLRQIEPSIVSTAFHRDVKLIARLGDKEQCGRIIVLEERSAFLPKAMKHSRPFSNEVSGLSPEGQDKTHCNEECTNAFHHIISLSIRIYLLPFPRHYGSFPQLISVQPLAEASATRSLSRMERFDAVSWLPQKLVCFFNRSSLSKGSRFRS